MEIEFPTAKKAEVNLGGGGVINDKWRMERARILYGADIALCATRAASRMHAQAPLGPARVTIDFVEHVS